MNKSDRKFITGLIRGVKTEVGGLRAEIKGVESRLEDKIRHNGILIERLRDDQKLLSEGFSGLAVRVGHIEADVSGLNDHMRNMGMNVSEIKERIVDYPMIREMAKDHDIKLAKLAK